MYSACRDNLGKLRYMWSASAITPPPRKNCVPWLYISFLFQKKHGAAGVALYMSCMYGVGGSRRPRGVALKQPPRCINLQNVSWKTVPPPLIKYCSQT